MIEVLMSVAFIINCIFLVYIVNAVLGIREKSDLLNLKLVRLAETVGCLENNFGTLLAKLRTESTYFATQVETLKSMTRDMHSELKALPLVKEPRPIKLETLKALDKSPEKPYRRSQT